MHVTTPPRPPSTFSRFITVNNWGHSHLFTLHMMRLTTDEPVCFNCSILTQPRYSTLACLRSTCFQTYPGTEQALAEIIQLPTFRWRRDSKVDDDDEPNRWTGGWTPPVASWQLRHGFKLIGRHDSTRQDTIRDLRVCQSASLPDRQTAVQIINLAGGYYSYPY